MVEAVCYGVGSPLVDTARFLDTAHQTACKRLVEGLGFRVSPFSSS